MIGYATAKTDKDIQQIIIELQKSIALINIFYYLKFYGYSISARIH